MSQKPIIQTKRLILRQWKDDDFELFAQLNADPRVMEFFPSVMSRQESDQLADRIQTKIKKKGWGMWAVSLVSDSTFIGFIGINDLDQSTFPAHFSPAIEVGWRLAYPYWGKGYATEGAIASLNYGFDTLNLDEIVAFTAVQNNRSKGVMEKIGMHRDLDDDFDHPKLPEGHWLSRHVLYRIKADEWFLKTKDGIK